MMTAMKIRHELTYDASPAEIYAMRADPAFREKVCTALDTVSHTVSIDEAGSGLSVLVDMVRHTEGVPSFAKKVVGDRTRIVQTESWGSAEAADLVLEIPGKPGHIRGRLTSTSNASGTVYAFEGEAKVAIPLVGGKLEGLVAELFTDGMDTEHQVGTAWLAGER